MSLAYMVFEEVREHTRRECRKAALELHYTLTARTPKDTGWARSNWIASVGTPSSDLYGDKSSVEPSAGFDSASVVFSWDPFKAPLYLTNNVPYIGVLNAGHSSQAEAEFIEHTIDEVLGKYGFGD